MMTIRFTLTRTALVPRQQAPRPVIESPVRAEKTGNFTCAHHIRGRIDRQVGRTASGHMRFIWQVVNTRTGEVVVESDAVGWTEAVASASEATFVARGARFWSLDSKKAGLK